MTENLEQPTQPTEVKAPKPRKVYPEVPCEQCGKLFERRRLWQRFCELNCRMQHHKFARKDLDFRITQLEQKMSKFFGEGMNG
jgi:ferredoxin